jgi:hypothetical protein
VLAAVLLAGCATPNTMQTDPTGVERQLTHAPHGHILTNTGVWSPDGEWIAYDVRSDAAGEKFDGSRIEVVNVRSREVRVLYESRNGAHCGVVTWHPQRPEVVFIHGPDNPTPDWQYGPFHREGALVAADRPGVARRLDARDLTPPFTPGALRGGSHVHLFSPDGEMVSFTYEDHVLAALAGSDGADLNQRNIGVTVLGKPVTVPKDHPRNHDGEGFTVVVTRTVNQPRPGSDEIQKAFEEGWVGTNGYVRADGSRQPRALAFQGHVASATGEVISEVFIADLPEDLTQPGDGPLAGTEVKRPTPPAGTRQRRLTFTTDRRFPGIQGPRHWLRASPDGSQIACMMKDDAGVVQLWTVSPNGGALVQLTHNPWSIASTFTWSPDGHWIAHVADNSVCVTDARTGETHRLTPRRSDAEAPRPDACVFSPDGRSIAYVRRVKQTEGEFNQVFVVTLPQTLR